MSDRWSFPRMWQAAALVVVLLAVLGVSVASAVRRDDVRLDQVASPPRHLLLDEQFDGTSLRSSVWNTCHWWVQQGGCTIGSNHEEEWYQPEQARVSGGQLHLVAEPKVVKGADGKTYPFVSGMVTTGPPTDGAPAKVAFTYGTVEARVLMPRGQGLWPALWMLPASEESRPEIDIIEVVGEQSRTALLHLLPKDRTVSTESSHVVLPGVDYAEGWHVVRLVWQPGVVTWFIDGRQVWQVKSSRVPSEPMYVVANLAVGGDYPGPPGPSTPFPATYAIDYLRIWQ